MPVLTARERAVLILRASKAKAAEDPLWRSTMPESQYEAFNRLIHIMNACDIKLAFLITMLEKEVEKLELKEAWWFSLLLWQLNLAEIDYAASIVARESITESEYAGLVGKQAEAFVSV